MQSGIFGYRQLVKLGDMFTSLLHTKLVNVKYKCVSV